MNTTLYAVWDDEAGFVTVPAEDRIAVEKHHAGIRELWKRLNVDDGNSRVREVHVHQVGTVRYEDPADDCDICNVALAAPSSVGV